MAFDWDFDDKFYEDEMNEDDEDATLSFNICEDCGCSFKGDKMQMFNQMQNHKCEPKEKLKHKVDKITGRYKWY